MSELIGNNNFNAEDPRLPSIKARLLLEPKKTDSLRRLFSRPIVSHRPEIVAVRLYDAVTFVNQYSAGALPADDPHRLEIPIDSRKKGRFYAGATFSHPDWKEISEKFSSPPLKNYLAEIQQSLHRFNDVPSVTAFLMNVTPHLKKGWLDAIRQYTVEYLEEYTTETEFSASHVLRTFINHLNATFKHLDEVNQSNASALDSHYQNDDLQFIIQQLKPDADLFSVLGFLRTAARDRAGIIVGFGPGLLQLPYEIKPDNLIASAKNLIVKPPARKINLSAGSPIIVAAETMAGPYEESLLQDMGIIRLF